MNQLSKTAIKAIICKLVLTTHLIFVTQAQSAGPVGKIDDVDFSFEGVVDFLLVTFTQLKNISMYTKSLRSGNEYINSS